MTLPSGRGYRYYVIPDKRLVATQQMLEEMRNIVAVLIGKALEGDTGAISVVLSKTLPSLKAQAEKVNFDLNTDALASEQVAQVLDAIASGALAPTWETAAPVRPARSLPAPAVNWRSGPEL